MNHMHLLCRTIERSCWTRPRRQQPDRRRHPGSVIKPRPALSPHQIGSRPTSYIAVALALYLALFVASLPAHAEPHPASAYQSASQRCFAVSDESTQGKENTLIEVILPPGGVGVGSTRRINVVPNGENIEAISLVPDLTSPKGFRMYAANAGQFGEIDFTPGTTQVSYAAAGSLTTTSRNDGKVRGRINGKQKKVTLNDVDSLTYDERTGRMYGAQRREGEFDLLFMIDLSLLPGALVIPEAFADPEGDPDRRFEFVEIRPAEGVDIGGLRDVDDIAIHPNTGQMVAVINTRGEGGRLAFVNIDSGAITRSLEIQVALDSGELVTVNDIEGLAFSSENPPQLYGSTGDNGPNGFDQNQLFLIDLESAAENQVMARSVAQFEQDAKDVEGLGCLTGESLTPAIDLEKFTNGVNADTQAEGPQVLANWPVTWTYKVTNTGEVDLTDVTLVDSQIGAIQCPATTLASGEAMTCSATGTAIEGNYRNDAIVTASSTAGPVSDEDPSHYTGIRASIQIEKSTNSQDADEAPGPQLEVGDSVTWEYTVVNTGEAALTDIVVSDDKIAADEISCPKTSLDAGESMTCSASGIAESGQYRNVATVTARATIDESGDCAIIDTDPSHYFAGTPGIDVEKSTNGVDADLPEEGPIIAANCPVEWAYVVTNSGDLPLSNVVLEDDKIGAIQCTDTLAVGESVTCSAPLDVAINSDYSNVATVSASSAVGAVTDTDPSHYSGRVASITIEKSTNGQDSDAAPGEMIPEGASVNWTYEVTNNGAIALRDLLVVDDQLAKGTIDCGNQETLAPGASMTCTATGIAIAGPYANLATVLAVPDISDGNSCSIDSSDPSHYEGVGELLIGQSSSVGWSYMITNTGEVTLANVTLDGGPDVVISGCQDITLPSGASIACGANGPEERFENQATVTATDPAIGVPVSFIIPAPQLDGLEVSIVIEDPIAELEAIPSLPVDSSIPWAFVITNNGATAVDNLRAEVVDLGSSNRQPISCPESTLTAGASMNCQATSTAIADRNGIIATVTGQLAGFGQPIYADSSQLYDGVEFATVGGRLFVDGQNLFGQTNGLQDMQEGSLRSEFVEISLYDSVDQLVQTAVASSGNYTFTNVWPGEYYMVVRRPSVPTGASPESNRLTYQGFRWTIPNRVNNRADSDADPDLHDEPDAARTEPIQLLSGEVDMSWDIGFEQLIVNGVAFIDENGNNEPDPGEPSINDANISITSALDPLGEAIEEATGIDGTYELSPAPGIYDITATHDDYRLQLVLSNNGTINVIATAASIPGIYIPVVTNPAGTSSAVAGGK